MKIRLLVTGRSYHQAASLPDELELVDGACISDAIKAVNELLPDDVQMAESCMLAVNGSHIGSVSNYHDAPISENAEFVVFTPVAGG